MLISRSNPTVMPNLAILRSRLKISRSLLTSGLFVFSTCLLNTSSARAWVPNSLGTGVSKFFSYAKLSNASGITNNGYSLKQEFYSDNTFSPAALLPSWTLTNPPNPVGEALSKTKILYIKDSWTLAANANGTLNNVGNDFAQSPMDVPGPWAWLGLVSGFGYSRKLRKRLKDSPLA